MHSTHILQSANAAHSVVGVTQETGRNSAFARQNGPFNETNIHQAAPDNLASVLQLGSGATGMRNAATVRQEAANNKAEIIQGAGVGPSPVMADPYDPFGPATRSAEAMILQGGLAGFAKIEQFGKGQRALIEQRGDYNSGTIRQEIGATNATAIIRQLGSSNSYSIVQTQPWQYIEVTQTGTGNSATNVVQRGPS